jgi:hypothetical protein
MLSKDFARERARAYRVFIRTRAGLFQKKMFRALKLTNAQVAAATAAGVLLVKHMINPPMQGEVAFKRWSRDGKTYEIRLKSNCWTPRILCEAKLYHRRGGEVPLTYLEDFNTITVRDNQLSDVWMDPAPFSRVDSLRCYAVLAEIESSSRTERQLLKGKINGDQFYLEVTYNSFLGARLTRRVPLRWKHMDFVYDSEEYY